MLTATGDPRRTSRTWWIGTKVRLLSETPARPSFGFRFATKLPNASNESGLGLDTMDFFASVLVAKTVQSVRSSATSASASSGDPTRGDRQNDVLTYGLSLARALTQAAEIVGEINGRFDTPKARRRREPNREAQFRLGARYTVGGWRGDAAFFWA